MKTRKVIGLFLAVLLAVLTFSGTANAERKVKLPSWKNGGTLWVQSRIEWGTGVLWPLIAERNGISDPKKLRIGQEIIIPDLDYVDITNHMTSPFGAKAEKGNEKVLGFIQATKVSDEVRSRLVYIVNNIEPEAYMLMRGEEAKYSSDESGVYGNNNTIFRFNWKKADFLKSHRWSIVIDNTAYELIVIESCGNANLRWRELAAEKIIMPTQVIAQEPEAKQEVVKEAPKKEVREFNPEDMVEIFAGAGYYTNVHDEIDADGYFAWALARFQPFKLSYEKFSVKLGAFIKGGIGGGDSSGYSYHSKYYLAGPSIKAYGDAWDMNADIGWGKQWKKGGRGFYRSQQEEGLFGISADLSGYKNRLDGKLWWPKWVVDLQYSKPYNVEHRHWWKENDLNPNPYDSERIEGGFTQFIYDFWSDDGLTRATPGIRLGGGHEWGPDKSFFRIGPRVQLATYQHSVLNLGYDWKEQLNGKGDSHVFGGSLNIVGLFDWFRILGIREAHADELNIPINFHN